MEGIGEPYSSDDQLISFKTPSGALAKFLSSLMGEKRSIERVFKCNFEIDLTWLRAFVELVEQRVISQNDGSLIKFISIFRYDDETLRKETSIEGFKNFHDLSSRMSVGFEIEMTYLIRFPYKEIPETQVIKFGGDAIGLLNRRADEEFSQSVRRIVLPIFQDVSDLYLIVEFTDLSWGEDIISLVQKHTFSNFPERSRWKDGVRTVLMLLSPAIGLASSFVMAAISDSRRYDDAMNKSSEVIEKFAKKFLTVDNTIYSVENKINLMYKLTHDDAAALHMHGSTAYLWFSLFLISIIFSLALRIIKPSYVILNKASETAVIRAKKTRSIVFSVLVVCLGFGIVAGLSANFIYSYLTKFN